MKIGRIGEREPVEAVQEEKARAPKAPPNEEDGVIREVLALAATPHSLRRRN